MKRGVVVSFFAAIGIIYSLGSLQSQSIVPGGGEDVYRIFFQTVEEDMRFTGCVNTGGMCYSPEETVVQDCKDSNGQWYPCGWE